MRFFTTLAYLSVLLLAASFTEAGNDVQGRRVIGYFPEWGVYYSPGYFITNLPPGKLTHVNYAFAKVDSANRIAVYDGYAATNMFYPGDCWDPGCERGSFHQITLYKQQHPDTKFLISVGGWTLSAPFYALAADATKRQTFAQSCADFLVKYPQFDGVDIDWEHPVIGGQEPWGTPADGGNFTLLLQAIRTAIGANRLLTVAVSASQTSITALEYPQMAGIVDWFNVMTYDFHGPWNNYVAHNSPLYNNSDPAGSKLNLHDTVQAVIARGVASTQVVAGLAFFGHGWGGVNSSNLYSSASGSGPGSLSYREIASDYANTNGYSRGWDGVALVPWLYNPVEKIWISFDDQESVTRKGEYVRTNNLGGAMFWEISQDNGELLDALRSGLSDPPFQIKGLMIQGDDIRVEWETRGGRINIVESADSVTGAFTNTSPQIAIPGFSDVTTNWLDPGGATNVPSRFYRIRWVQ